MKKLFSFFIAFSIVFFLALFIYIGVLIRNSRDTNIRQAEQVFSQLKTEAVSSYLASQSFASSFFKSQMNDTFYKNNRLLLVAIYSREEGMMYLLTKNKSHFFPTHESDDISPQYSILPLSETRISLPFAPAPRKDLFIDGIYLVLGRRDIYPILRNAFFILLVFLLFAGIFILVTVSLFPKIAESPEEEQTVPEEAQSEYRFLQALEHALRGAVQSDTDLVSVEVQIDNFSDLPYHEQVYSSVLEQTKDALQSKAFPVSHSTGCAAVCIPNTDLDAALHRCEQMRQDIVAARHGERDTTVSIGLTSRNQREVDADVLYFETQKALEKAQQDGMNQVVAFRADPQKYKDLIGSDSSRPG